ncbi:hypothetical protein WN944_022177 [Citrus x changshan-huyou]|uniref:Uncharacterized protein n=1 Tax=Citrus x changshan-huyou TaxID=2935761 RepID=A0AAP0MY56_9ROSI
MQNLTTDAITTSNTIPAESSQIQAINFPNFRGKICGETHGKREKADGECCVGFARLLWELCVRERESQRPDVETPTAREREKVDGERTEQGRRKMKRLRFGVGFACSFAV